MQGLGRSQQESVSQYEPQAERVGQPVRASEIGEELDGASEQAGLACPNAPRNPITRIVRRAHDSDAVTRSLVPRLWIPVSSELVGENPHYAESS